MTTESPQDARPSVVAFGGNALVRPDQEGHIDEQVRNAEVAISALRGLIESEAGILIVHGNGPQVGHELLRQEEASTKLPAMPLDACVAHTQGLMGYILERALRNYMTRIGLERGITTLLTQVVVDPRDRAFRHPTKPIGPFYTRFRARQLMTEKGWVLIEDAGRGYRKVVPSPRPVKILGLDTARTALESGHLVIVGGGGGIPVALDAMGMLHGVEAVIDKDYTGSMIAREVQADSLILLTGVPQVAVHYGTPEQEELFDVTVEQLVEHQRAGHFPDGSMGPKITAAIEFLEAGGAECLITSAESLSKAFAGDAGTRISTAPHNARAARGRQLKFDL